MNKSTSSLSESANAALMFLCQQATHRIDECRQYAQRRASNSGNEFRSLPFSEESFFSRAVTLFIHKKQIDIDEFSQDAFLLAIDAHERNNVHALCMLQWFFESIEGIDLDFSEQVKILFNSASERLYSTSNSTS